MVDGLVVEVAPLLELALHEAEVQVLRLVLALRLLELGAERRELRGVLTRGHAGARVVDRLGRGLVRRVRVEPLLLLRDAVLDALDLEAAELGLELLPGPPEDVVVRHGPERADEQQQRAHEPQRPVGALLVVQGSVLASGHLASQLRGSISRPIANRARPVSER